MHKSLSLIGVSGIIAIAFSSTASADSGTTTVLNGMSWESFASATPAASLAWAGEDETYAAAISLLGSPRQAVTHDEDVVDPELLTGLPAPEPPAIVLAGLAFGGVLCGRSLLARRRRSELDVAGSESQS